MICPPWPWPGLSGKKWFCSDFNLCQILESSPALVVCITSSLNLHNHYRNGLLIASLSSHSTAECSRVICILRGSILNRINIFVRLNETEKWTAFCKSKTNWMSPSKKRVRRRSFQAPQWGTSRWISTQHDFGTERIAWPSSLQNGRLQSKKMFSPLDSWAKWIRKMSKLIKTMSWPPW